MATVDYAHVRNSTSILEGGQIAIAIKIGKDSLGYNRFIVIQHLYIIIIRVQ